MVHGLRVQSSGKHVRDTSRKVNIRLPEKGNSNSHGARPVYQKHLRHDEVVPDQKVVNKEFSLSVMPWPADRAARHGGEEAM